MRLAVLQAGVHYRWLYRVLSMCVRPIVQLHMLLLRDVFRAIPDRRRGHKQSSGLIPR